MTFDPEDPDVQEELECACLDAIRGDPPSTAVARRLEHAVRKVLQSYGLEGAVIRASSDRRLTQVQIKLPPEVPHVREFVLTVG